MESTLNLLGALFTMASLASCMTATGGLTGMTSMVVAAVFFGSGAIVGAINKLRLPPK